MGNVNKHRLVLVKCKKDKKICQKKLKKTPNSTYKTEKMTKTAKKDKFFQKKVKKIVVNGHLVNTTQK